MDSSNDWDLQAVVRSCGTPGSSGAPVESPPPARKVVDAGGAEFLGQQPVLRLPPAATSWRDLDYLNLDHEQLPPFSITPPSCDDRARGGRHDVLISFPPASTSSWQQQTKTKQAAGLRKPGVRTPRPKRSKKSQLKKAVCEVPAADGGVSTDQWAWRKYGQKPIKGSPYPRGYYKCSSLKACTARKLVERSPEKPGVLVVTYIGDHSHAVPTMLNALAGTTRHGRPPPSPDHHHSHCQSDEASGATSNNRRDNDDSADASSMTVDGGGSAETPDDENNVLWPVDDMALLDEYHPLLDDFVLGPLFDDELDLSVEDEHGGLGRRLSL